jgi:hypothetical protein
MSLQLSIPDRLLSSRARFRFPSPDLVVVDCGTNNQNNCAGGSVGVLLGNGDGTFQAAKVTSLAPYGATSVAVADVNGDGGGACTVGAVGNNDIVTLSITTTSASALRSPLLKHHQQLFYAILLPGFLGMVSMTGRRGTLRGLRLLALIVVLGLVAL